MKDEEEEEEQEEEEEEEEDEEEEEEEEEQQQQQQQRPVHATGSSERGPQAQIFHYRTVSCIKMNFSTPNTGGLP